MGLLQDLQVLELGYGSEISTAQSDCVAFTDECAYTFNKNVYVRVNRNYGISGAVGFRALLDTIKLSSSAGLDVDSMVIQQKAPTRVTFSVGNSKSVFSVVPDIRLGGLVLPEIPTDGWRPFTEELRSALTFCSDLAKSVVANPDDEKGRALSRVHCTENWIEGGTTYRIVRFIDSFGSDPDFLLSGKYLSSVLKYQWDEYATDNRWVFFRRLDAGGNPDVVCALIKVFDGYAELDEIFDGEGETIKFPQELLPDIRIVKGLLKEYGTFTVTFRDGICTIEGSLGATFGHTASHPVEYQGTLSFSMRPGNLEELLTKFPYAQYVVSGSAGRFKSGNERCTYVVGVSEA